MFDSGARLSEIANIRMDDLILKGTIPDEITVTGKGGSRRGLVVKPSVGQALRRYLRERQGRKDARSPWLWLGRRGHLEAAGLGQMVGRRRRKLDLPTSTRTYSATPSPTRGSPTAATRAT